MIDWALPGAGRGELPLKSVSCLTKKGWIPRWKSDYYYKGGYGLCVGSPLLL